jgi:hypothetical protein
VSSPANGTFPVTIVSGTRRKQRKPVNGHASPDVSTSADDLRIRVSTIFSRHPAGGTPVLVRHDVDRGRAVGWAEPPERGDRAAIVVDWVE